MSVIRNSEVVHYSGVTINYHYTKIIVVRACVRTGVHRKRVDHGAKTFVSLQS